MDKDWRFINVEWNALRVYDDRYIKAKIRTYSNEGYANFCGLNVPEDNIVIFMGFLLLHENKYYLQVYSD